MYVPCYAPEVPLYMKSMKKKREKHTFMLACCPNLLVCNKRASTSLFPCPNKKGTKKKGEEGTQKC